jgi:hypothetical protein
MALPYLRMIFFSVTNMFVSLWQFTPLYTTLPRTTPIKITSYSIKICWLFSLTADRHRGEFAMRMAQSVSRKQPIGSYARFALLFAVTRLRLNNS